MSQDAAVVASRMRLVECDSDRQLLELWLQGKSPQTRRSYERDVMSFLLPLFVVWASRYVFQKVLPSFARI